MGLFNKLKEWLTGGKSSKKKSSGSRSSGVPRSSSSGSSQRGGADVMYRRAAAKKKEEEDRRREKVREAFSAKGFSSGISTPASNRKTELQAQLKKDIERKQKTPKPKTKFETEKDAFNAATGNRYNVSGAKTKKEELKRRQAQKSQAYDPQVAEYEYKAHPKASSAARGALSGVTFGASEIAAAKLTRNEARQAEEVYQANKRRGYEIGGEIAGSLLGFGLTGGASAKGVKAAATKLAPRLVEKETARAVEKTAASKLIRRASEKEALKRFGIDGATEEVISQIAKRRAERAVAELGKDAAINITTGLASDVNHSLIDSENWQEFMQNMGVNAGINVALGGATSLVPAFRVGKTASTEALDGLVRNAAQNADNGIRPDEAVNIRDLARPQNLDAAAKNQQIVETIAKEDEAAVSAVEEVKPDLNDDKTAKELLGKRGGFEEKLSFVRESIEKNKEARAAAENGSEERMTLDREYRNLQQQRRRLEKKIFDIDNIGKETAEPPKPKVEAKAEPPKKAEEFAAVDDNAAEVGIIPDSKLRPSAKKPEKNLKPNVVEKSEGRKVAEEVADKIGVKSNSNKVKTPLLSDVDTVDSAYNKMQGSKKKTVLSRGAVTEMRKSLGDEQRKRINSLIQAGKLNYTRVTNKEKLTEVAKEFHREPEHWANEMISYAHNIDNMPASKAVDTKYMATWISDYTGTRLKDYPELQAVHDAATEVSVRLSSMSGQINQLQGQFAKCQPLGRRRTALQTMVDMLDRSVGVRKKGITTADGKRLKISGDRETRRKEIAAILEKDERVKAALDKIQNSSTPDEISKNTGELLDSVNRLNTRTWFDYLQQARYAGMLGNAKTMIRNRWGNSQFAAIRQVSNAIGSGVEKAIKNGTNNEFLKKELENSTRGGVDLGIRRQSRIKGEKLTDKAAKEAYEAWKEAEPLLTSATKYENRQGGGGSKNVFAKAIDFWSEAISGRLEKDDAKALERNFREAYMKGAKKLEKNGKDLADPEVKELLVQRATREAQVATFREYNAMASTLNKYTNYLYDADASFDKKLKGFAVNSAIPFAKTPANILKQSVNYSPVGVFKGFVNIRKAASSGDAMLLHEAIDQFSSGLTGTGIAVAGYLFGRNTDAFTTNAGKNDYDSKFEKLQGVQNYSVKFEDPITGKTHSYTLDWLVPTSTTFFAGVELANQLKGSGYLDIIEAAGDIGQIASRVVEPVMETSMLSGIYNIIEDLRGNASSDDDKLGFISILAREIGQSYVNSLVPTLVGQVARTAYKSDKAITGANDTEYFINSLKSKLGLAGSVGEELGLEPLGADTTAYGDVKNAKQMTLGDLIKGDPKAMKEYGSSALNNLVLPMNIQEVDLSSLDKQKLEEYRKRVKAGEDPEDLKYLFPQKQYRKNFTYGDNDVEMSNVELSTYNQAKTTGGSEGMRVALEGIMFNRYVEDGSGKKTILKNGYTAEEKEKLIKGAEGKSLREIEQWLYKQPQFRSASEAEQKRVLNHLWALNQQGKSQGAKRVGEQAVIESRGGDVDEYNFINEVSDKKREALQPYIDAGVLTYEEAVDFARYAGKTYYYEDDEGGRSQTYFNKAQMIAYLEKKGYSREKAEALYNSFKQSNAKPYGSSSGRRGYRRRGYRRRGGGGSRKAPAPKLKSTSAYKAKQFKSKVKASGKSSKGTTSLAAALDDIRKTEAKVKPPTPKGAKK